MWFAASGRATATAVRARRRTRHLLRHHPRHGRCGRLRRSLKRVHVRCTVVPFHPFRSGSRFDVPLLENAQGLHTVCALVATPPSNELAAQPSSSAPPTGELAAPHPHRKPLGDTDASSSPARSCAGPEVPRHVGFERIRMPVNRPGREGWVPEQRKPGQSVRACEVSDLTCCCAVRPSP